MTTPQPIPILRFKPTAEGLERWLGCLEAETMRIVWAANGPRTVKQVLHTLRQDYCSTLAYTTAMTTMQRLCRKGLLQRDAVRRQGNTHCYRPSCSEAEFVELQARAILRSLEEAK